MKFSVARTLPAAAQARQQRRFTGVPLHLKDCVDVLTPSEFGA
jgi:hypothetical protein